MRFFLAFMLVIFSTTIFAQEPVQQQGNATNYVKDLHFTELDPAYNSSNDEQIIVYEFFGYKCPHCEHFQAYVSPWQKKLPKHIKLVRIPVVFQPGWDILAKAYYTSETMGIAEKTHDALFKAIHQQRKRFGSIEALADWYAENFNVDKAAFLSTANSFMIDSKVRQSVNMTKKMQINGTPALVIDGKYKPNTKVVNNYTGILDLALFLANKEAVIKGLGK